MREIEVCVRIDDFVYPTSAMTACIDWHLAAGLAVSVAVIPADLKTVGIGYLKDINERYPGQVEVSQHGFDHRRRARGRQLFEVGPGMCFNVQRTIIQNGARLLSRSMGRLFRPVFVPPFNGFDLQTVYAAKSLGFEVISAEFRLPSLSFPAGIREVSTNLDLLADYGPPARLKATSVIQRELTRLMESEPFLGILIHPDIAMPSRDELSELWAHAHRLKVMRPTVLSEALRGIA